ncbi:MAG: hypothetical protein JO345_04565 [Streptosporangiaceae bacterium]|nr:hypothetical protein [Streptosporangiaceae bacterium]
MTAWPDPFMGWTWQNVRHAAIAVRQGGNPALTVLNAAVGLRQEGKAESAMNALKSMMKTTARVRRAGAESQVPAEQVVIGQWCHVGDVPVGVRDLVGGPDGEDGKRCQQAADDDEYKRDRCAPAESPGVCQLALRPPALLTSIHSWRVQDLVLAPAELIVIDHALVAEIS